MTTQHTPGPWRTVRFVSKFDARKHSFGIAYGRSGNRLAIVDGECSASDANAANARLIAAAPDLLEALLYASDRLEVCNFEGDKDEALKHINAVIAKAKGE